MLGLGHWPNWKQEEPMDEAYFTQRPRFSSRLGVVVKRHPALTARVAIKMLQVRAASAVKVLRVMLKAKTGKEIHYGVRPMHERHGSR